MTFKEFLLTLLVAIVFSVLWQLVWRLYSRTNSIAQVKVWLTRMWQPRNSDALLHAYNATFSTPYGILVLQDLMDNVYCTVYEGTDPQAALVHNARRTVVHEILENLDRARVPQKYTPPVIEEKSEWAPSQS